jgi:putative ABC transport system permease protein
MLWTTLQGLIAHRFRLFATALAVTLGVAFTAGTLTFNDTIARTFDNLMGEIYAGTDVVVRGQEQFEGPMGSGAQRASVDASLVDRIAQLEEVDAVEGGATGYARITDGTQALGNPANGAPTLGLTWSADDRINPLVVTDGREPRAGDEVVIDAPSAKKAGIALGETATIVVTSGPVEKTVVGIAAFGSAETIGGATMVGFHDSVAQELLGEPGRWMEISVVAAEGVSQEQLADRVATVLPEGVEAVTGTTVTEENQEWTRDAMQVFVYFMNAFAVVALLVAAFMIFNTFSITVAQRTRENGLYRALGASRSQVLGAVLLEALVIGVVASVVGLAGGFAIATGLKALLDGLGFGIPAGGLVFSGRTVAVALTAGIVITMVSAVSPARKAAKVAPIAALSSDVVGSVGYGSGLRMAIGSVSLVGGAALTVGGLFSGVDNAWLLVVLGALAVFLGIFVLGRTVSLPMSRFLGAPLPRLRGLTGELARENAMRNPKRTAIAGSALMLGVAVVVVLTTFVASIKATVDEGIDRAFAADLVVESGASFNGGIDPGVAARLAELPEVEAATGLSVLPAQVDGQSLLLGAIDPATAFRVLDLQPLEGSTEALGSPDAIAVHQKEAQAKGLQVGSTVPVVFRDTGERQLTVAMVYGETLEANGPDGQYLLGKATYAANSGTQSDWKVLVLRATDTTLVDARTAVEGAVAAYPGVEVLDKEEFADAVKAGIDPMLALSYALLGLAILIALMGIANTLALSIFERTRELGLLRAVGMTRSQLRTVVRWESVIIAVFGAALGLVIGLFFGWALFRALADEGFREFRVPVGTLATVTVLAALAGVVAAILPARRAARLDVLQAIASE